MRKIFSIVVLGILAASAQAIAGQEIESDLLVHPDDIVREEAYIQMYNNYLAPPETTKATPAVDPQQLRYKSEIELAASLASVDAAADECIAQREAMEAEIGTSYGSWSVNPAWVTKYQLCILQLQEDLKTFGAVLEFRYTSIVETGGADGATLQTELIDRLRTRHSIITQKVDQELSLQKQFVAYYNTGDRDY